MAKLLPRAALSIALFAATVSAAPPAQPDPLQVKVDAIRDRFVAAARACGLKPAFVPKVVLETGPAVISYEGKSQSLHIGRYEALPPPIQSFVTDWAAHDMPGKGPAVLFDTLFNGFLVGHELGHWVDDMNGRQTRLDHYDQEIEANRFAIAFAGLTPAGIAARDRDVAAFSYLGTLPDPVPKGEDARAWFDAHYEEIADTNPPAYNWYQGLFMRTAWEQRNQADFCSLARLKAGDAA